MSKKLNKRYFKSFIDGVSYDQKVAELRTHILNRGWKYYDVQKATGLTQGMVNTFFECMPESRVKMQVYFSVVDNCLGALPLDGRTKEGRLKQ